MSKSIEKKHVIGAGLAAVAVGVGYWLYRSSQQDNSPPKRKSKKKSSKKSKPQQQSSSIEVKAKEVAGGALKLYHQGKYEEAAEEFRKSTILAPDDFRLHMNLANSYIKLNRFDEAEQSTNRVLELKPGNPKAFYVRAKIHAQKEDYPAAIQDLDTALADPALPDSIRKVASELRKSCLTDLDKKDEDAPVRELNVLRYQLQREEGTDSEDSSATDTTQDSSLLTNASSILSESERLDINPESSSLDSSMLEDSSTGHASDVDTPTPQEKETILGSSAVKVEKPSDESMLNLD